MRPGRDERPPRILIVKPSSLGDIVHALPVLAGLRAAYPTAHIAWLAGSSFAGLLDGHPLLDEVIPFDRRRFGRMLTKPRALVDFVRFVRALRGRQFDLAIDLQGLFRSGFLAWVCGAKRRVGFRAARELGWLFYTERVPGSPGPRGDVHAVDRNLALARTLGLTVDPPQFPLGVRDDELRAASAALAKAAGRALPHFVAVLPGARWSTKQWRTDRLAGLIEKLQGACLPPAVLLGAPDEQPIVDAIRTACHSPVIDVVGRTNLRELTACLALADLVVCQDSGPMHIAVALGKPLVAIFGPTNPARTGPYSPSAQVVSLPLPCAPCYKRECPLGHHNCMQQLEVETVARAVIEMWAVHQQRNRSKTGATA